MGYSFQINNIIDRNFLVKDFINMVVGIKKNDGKTFEKMKENERKGGV